MLLRYLDVPQIFGITGILVPSLVAIWVIFLQKDLSVKIAVFKEALREYEKSEAKNLFEKIKNIVNEKKTKEEALDVISEYTNEWLINSEAITRLLDKEEGLYKIGKWVIIGLAAVFASGFYASSGPEMLFLDIKDTTRLGTAQFIFIVEVFLIIYWFWKIFDFAKIINRVHAGEIKDIIEDIIEEMAKEKEHASVFKKAITK